MTQDTGVFKGGVAVITGAGSGIGEGLARLAARQGMRVVLADVAMERAESVAEDIRSAGAEALAVHTDVSEPEALDRLAAVTHETFGDVTLLVNNAGIETLGFCWELPAAVWEKTLNINIHGAIHGVRAFAPRMLEAGKRAWIANTTSIGGLGMMPIQTSYVLSKHAILSFSECLYLEMQVKKAPIQVSAILPGPVATRIFEDSKTGEDPVNAHHREIMRNMLKADGISGYEAAERILPQLAEGKFWVSTHPEITAEFAANRAQHLSSQADPMLPPEVLAGLGVG
ncbi:MAG TPA: short-chain dehydrogenase [Halieaceae bacterium]|jgi:NAD(P)-dependent dehydrogenase (short-subunit alcohol dehydrogenase family)|nr:SDR family NAD(P)-dependent oxidoreductase [Haliea sp.]HAN69714.1 short-chain dehydrogenase [Halieaceae bacterium]MAY91306.1 short-chain dehydrogenase [Haliea sp.]MBK40795.1 short-chain dehydrogenase [Haliea sp.]MBP69191.1 short-chain dehydrogenase [Haliea sp.]HBM84601.1 short-chain dehydrogenase [Halieaceae bacterium]|tara:strand:- start:25319 stop:26173 length:855 start_codon:yes stop_codon:yes gene_type:complete